MSEHRYDIRISESGVDLIPLKVERQDPDNFIRFQTWERWALEIAAYVFNHRQKLIKLANSSKLGWKVVQEYESHLLADDSDDEKRMYRATARATRKMKQDQVRFQRRPRP